MTLPMMVGDRRRHSARIATTFLLTLAVAVMAAACADGADGSDADDDADGGDGGRGGNGGTAQAVATMNVTAPIVMSTAVACSPNSGGRTGRKNQA